MEDFDLKKYLAEGKLLKEASDYDEEYGKTFAVDVYYGWVEDGDGTQEKLPDGKGLKTYIQFSPHYYSKEDDNYVGVDDTDDGRYDKISNLDLWGIYNPDTMKPWEGNGEFDWNSSDTYYFDTEQEMLNFGEIQKKELENNK